MLLEKWLTKNRISKNAFALSIDLSPTTLYQVCSGERRFSAAVAKRIEEATGGAVSRCEAIWPEEYLDEEDFRAMESIYIVRAFKKKPEKESPSES